MRLGKCFYTLLHHEEELPATHGQPLLLRRVVCSRLGCFAELAPGGWGRADEGSVAVVMGMPQLWLRFLACVSRHGVEPPPGAITMARPAPPCRLAGAAAGAGPEAGTAHGALLLGLVCRQRLFCSLGARLPLAMHPFPAS